MAGAAAKPALPPALPAFADINRYWDPVHGTVAAKILPGQFYVTLHDEAIVTVLGSCVAACVRDRVFGIGGMNHFMLPERGGAAGACLSSANRYGGFAMESLINAVLANGGQRKNLEVKVFGGGRMLQQMTDIGRRNIDFVLDYLRTEALALAAKDLGGIHPRKVVYLPASGRVRVKRLGALHNDTLLMRERRYREALERTPIEGSVELF